MLKELVKRNAEAGIIESNLLSRLWDISSRHQQLPQLVEWLKEQRNAIPLGYFVEVARLWMRHNKPQEALEWLNEALAIAKGKDWLKDAEIHALVYYLLRSPNPQDFERAQELRAKVARTSALFHPETYELQLKCLLQLGRKEEAKQVLDEATRLYPDYPFVDRVQGLAQIAVINWATELERVKERWQKLAVPDHDALLRLAYATVKAGKAPEANRIADELMAGQPNWREGYLLAVNMFVNRISALVPFVRWVQSRVPEYQFAGWLRTVEPTGNTILNLGETSLYGAFMIASVLLAETGNTDVWHLIETSTSKWWASLKPEDGEELGEILAKERLNQHALDLMHIKGYMADFPNREAFQKWLEQIQKTQTWSAQAIISQIQRGMPTITREQLNEWLNSLEKADWRGVDWHLLTTPLYGGELPKKIAHKGFREEAITLLKIALKHAPEGHKPKLMAQLAELTGKLPEPHEGDKAKDGKALLLWAQTAWQANRLDEAKQAAQRALELGLSLEDQTKALKILAQVDPELALEEVSKRLPNFLVAEPHSDPPYHLQCLSDVLYQIAKERKDLASKVAPLLEPACNFSRGMRINMFSELALVHFWSGNNLRGIATLCETLDKDGPQWILRKVMGVMICADVPEEARRQIAKHLSSYLQSRKILPSVLAEELRNVRELNLLYSFNPQTRQLTVNAAPDSLIELAQILRRCLETAEGIIPRDFLEQTLWQVKRFAITAKQFSQERLLDEVANAWWGLFEAAFNKAVKASGDEKSLKQWLRQLWIERPDTDFSKTIWFERLKKLAE